MAARACSLCYQRKIKCNRQTPCNHCTHAGVECTPRHARSGRIARSRQLVGERMERLTNRILQLEAVTGDLSRTSHAPGSSLHSSPVIEPPTIPRRNEGASVGFEDGEDTTIEVSLAQGPSTKPSNGPNTPEFPGIMAHTEAEAERFLRDELHHQTDLTPRRYQALQASLSFIGEVSVSSSSEAPTTVLPTAPKSDCEITHEEIAHMVVASKENHGRLWADLCFPDHITPPALERIGLVFLDPTLDEQLRAQYSVTIHYKAALMYDSHLSVAESNPAVIQLLRKMRSQHLNTALAALSRVSLLNTPSLSLLQTLLTGASLSQILGDSPRVWTLMSIASRFLVALGYHKMTGSETRSEELDEIRACVAWCYHLDKVMSLLLCRPQSLPQLQVAASSLVLTEPLHPMAGLVRMLMDMAECQEKALNLSKSYPRDSAVTLREEYKSLYQDLVSIGQRISHEVSRTSSDENVNCRVLEFQCYCVQTTILRLSLDVAADLLEIHNDILSHGQSVDVYRFYLSWTFLLYPLLPFYVLFCNVVCTSNEEDFRLMENISGSLSEMDSSISKLRSLCAGFVSLCKPLIGHGRGHIEANRIRSNYDVQVPGSVGLRRTSHERQVEQNQQETQTPKNQTTTYTSSQNGFEEGWERENALEDMALGLWQSWPSLDWCNTALLNAPLIPGHSQDREG